MQCWCATARLRFADNDGINSGPGEAVKALQEIVRVATQMRSISPITLCRAPAHQAEGTRSHRYSEAGLAARLDYPEFEPGWTTRVNQIQAVALKMLKASQISNERPGRDSQGDNSLQKIRSQDKLAP